MRFYIPHSDRSFATAWQTVAGRVGASVSDDPNESRYVLPCSNSSAKSASGIPGLNFMSREAFNALTGRIGAQDCGIPCLPTVLPLEPSHLDALSGPVFVKRDYTERKITNLAAYTTWESAAEFVQAMPAEFWQHQRDNAGNSSAYVVQPAVAFPQEIIGLHTAVNERSEILVYRTHLERSPSANKYSRTTAVDRRPDLEAIVQAACTEYAVQGGLHHIQFIQHKGQWRLLDWNPRPTQQTSSVHALNPGFADAGLAHMLGLPYDGPDYPNFEWTFPK